MRAGEPCIFGNLPRLEPVDYMQFADFQIPESAIDFASDGSYLLCDLGRRGFIDEMQSTNFFLAFGQLISGHVLVDSTYAKRCQKGHTSV